MRDFISHSIVVFVVIAAWFALVGGLLLDVRTRMGTFALGVSAGFSIAAIMLKTAFKNYLRYTTRQENKR